MIVVINKLITKPDAHMYAYLISEFLELSGLKYSNSSPINIGSDIL